MTELDRAFIAAILDGGHDEAPLLIALDSWDERGVCPEEVARVRAALAAGATYASAAGPCPDTGRVYVLLGGPAGQVIRLAGPADERLLALHGPGSWWSQRRRGVRRPVEGRQGRE